MSLRVSPLIGSGMVLQEGVSVPVWGEAEPGAEVSVSFMGKIYRATADSSGAWRLFLDNQSSGGPYTMEIISDKPADGNPIMLNDIYAGDVWLCSGQSNMEMPMREIKDDFPEEWQPPVNALIRQFRVPQEWDFSGPRKELSGGCWKAAAAGPAEAETLDEFSACAWFFASALYEKHPKPIGLVNAAWGGTPVESWMSRDALAAFPAIIAKGDQYNNPAKCAEIIRANEAAIKAWEDNAAAADRGLAESWQRPETDIGAWSDISLPDNFAGTVPENFSGVIWLRREFEASGEFAAEESRLWMGTIVDADTAYVNGVEVGSTPYRYPQCKYTIPAGLLHAGKNQIVIRVICRDGDGGVTRDKVFRIFTKKSNGRCSSIDLGGTWKYRIGMSAPFRPEEFFIHRQPMCLFNAMIAPLTDYPCKGVIWYQGESNDVNPHEYEQLFRLMINDWRSRYKNPLPFLLVQLPIYGDPEDNHESSPWAIIREAQRSALSLPATGMAAGLDLGEWNDLHPVNKKDIGRRLALAAEKVVFNTPNTSPGPLVRGVERRGNKLLISFDNCGDGLTADGQPHVSIVSGGQVYRVAAKIDGPDCISIDMGAIENPEKILYAWAKNPRDRQLFNADGLPVIPFNITLFSQHNLLNT